MNQPNLFQRFQVFASRRWLPTLTLLAAVFAAWRFGATSAVQAQQPHVLAGPQIDAPAGVPLTQPLARPALAQTAVAWPSLRPARGALP